MWRRQSVQRPFEDSRFHCFRGLRRVTIRRYCGTSVTDQRRRRAVDCSVCDFDTLVLQYPPQVANTQRYTVSHEYVVLAHCD